MFSNIGSSKEMQVVWSETVYFMVYSAWTGTLYKKILSGYAGVIGNRVHFEEPTQTVLQANVVALVVSTRDCFFERKQGVFSDSIGQDKNKFNNKIVCQQYNKRENKNGDSHSR